MNNLNELERRAIENLKSFEPDDGYYLCYSGGKDSDVIRILAQLAGVKHGIYHNLTTVDAPETMQYIKTIPGVSINRPKRTMWQLIVDKGMPPTRLVRYCCGELKEKGGAQRVKITGVRWAESTRRAENTGLVKIVGKPVQTAKYAEHIAADYRITRQNGMVLNDDNDKSRAMVEYCYRTTSTMVNPIVEWSDSDVWEFLKHYGCAGNPLYQTGFHRVGCIGCPLAGCKRMKDEFKLYPIYEKNYVRAFDRMLTARNERGLQTNDMWRSGKDVMKWWVGDDPRQLTFDDVDEILGTEERDKWL